MASPSIKYFLLMLLSQCAFWTDVLHTAKKTYLFGRNTSFWRRFSSA